MNNGEIANLVIDDLEQWNEDYFDAEGCCGVYIYLGCIAKLLRLIIKEKISRDTAEEKLELLENQNNGDLDTAEKLLEISKNKKTTKSIDMNISEKFIKDYIDHSIKTLEGTYNADGTIIVGSIIQTLRDIKPMLDMLEQKHKLINMKYESPNINKLELARVQSHFKVNRDGYYINIKKGTKVVINHATQELYGITDSVTMEILDGIVLKKEY